MGIFLCVNSGEGCPVPVLGCSFNSSIQAGGFSFLPSLHNLYLFGGKTVQLVNKYLLSFCRRIIFHQGVGKIRKSYLFIKI